MKALIQSKALVKELHRISPVIGQTVSMPILSCVKLDFTKEKVTITGTDLSNTVITTAVCECNKDFTIVVGFDELHKLCSKVDDVLTIELQDDKILITGMDCKFKLSRTEDEHFPKIDDERFDTKIAVDNEFFSALHFADQCKSPDELNTKINEACIHLQKTLVSVIGTDANSLYKKDFKVKAGKDRKVMIAEKFIKMVKTFDDLDLLIGEKFIKATYGNVTVISRLSEKVFVDYTVLTNHKPEGQFNFKTKSSDLLKALGAVSSTSDKSTNMCEMVFEENEVKITSKDIDFGKEGEYRLKATHESPIPRIGFNAADLIKLITFCGDDEVEMNFKEVNTSIFIQSPNDPLTLCALQPLYIQN